MLISRLVHWSTRYWIIPFSIVWGIYIGLPWLAPVSMKVGWTNLAHAIYWLYSFQCHQFPELSFFLFGRKPTYSLEEIQAAWQFTNNPLILRQFLGNPDMGWKVAWCERTTWWYGSIWLGAWPFYIFRKKIPAFPLWALILSAMPMAIDGVTHTISDLAGIGAGFRNSNGWLVAMTQHTLSNTFYTSDAFGSFNFWMRMASGVILGIALVWFVVTRIGENQNSTGLLRTNRSGW